MPILLEVPAEILELPLQFRQFQLQGCNSFPIGRPSLLGCRWAPLGRFLGGLHVAGQQLRPALFLEPRLPRKHFHKFHLGQTMQGVFNRLKVVEGI